MIFFKLIFLTLISELNEFNSELFFLQYLNLFQNVPTAATLSLNVTLFHIQCSPKNKWTPSTDHHSGQEKSILD